MLNVPEKELADFANCKTGITPDLAARIAKATDTPADTWLNIQLKLNLWEISQRDYHDVQLMRKVS